MTINELKTLLFGVRDSTWKSLQTIKPTALARRIKNTEDPNRQIALAAAAFKVGAGEAITDVLLSVIDKDLIWAADKPAYDVFDDILAQEIYSDAYIVAFSHNEEKVLAAYQNCPEFPEYTFSEIVDKMGGLPPVTSLQDITYLELWNQCRGFQNVYSKEHAPSGFEGIYSYKTRWEDFVKDLKRYFNGRKAALEEKFSVKKIIDNTEGGQIFTYMEIDDAVQSIQDDPELAEIVINRCADGSYDFAKDSNCISPSPLLDIFSYKRNIIQWLKATYNINVKAPMYWNQYNVERVFEYESDEDMFTAVGLRNEPVFQGLLKVTRTGIVFTHTGAEKLWYDFTKDIATAADIPFNCKPL